ncbi:hypothetical protein L1987_30612 [Smallanthus sonchifolius]|uniref:Uncharacterized protein n=1 Tax=Smallanthus sonchifolius TaxID=185202 RepID=A0ACB9I4Q3_9ASTR|nr:hypothetical protein L1987_30612 [Smallanthus sonchifolius]
MLPSSTLRRTRLIKSGGTRWLDDTPSFRFKTVPDGLPLATEDDVEHTQTTVEVRTYMGTNFYDSFLDVMSGLETPVTCIVCDGFITYTNMMNDAEKLKIPIILFWTMAACGFMGFYQVKVLMEKGLVPLKGSVFPIMSIRGEDGSVIGMGKN